MTEQHPLTDKVIDSHENWGCVCYEGIMYDHSDLRAAADWQLEQVVEWIKRHPWVGSDCPIYDFEDEQDRSQLIADLKKAMRPTTTQEES